MSVIRELTQTERRQIKELVRQCANYDSADKICLPADKTCSVMDCYMLHKEYTGCLCKYFINAVLPLNPQLHAALTYTEPVATRQCAHCGKEFVPPNNRAKYCGAKCKQNGNKIKSRERMQRMRENSGVNVTI